MKLKQTRAAKKARRRTITVCISFLLLVALCVGLWFGISACVTRYQEKKKKEAAAASAAAAEASMDALDHYIANMTLEEKLLQMFLVSPEELTGVSVVTTSGDNLRTSLNQYPVGGLIYHSMNLTSEAQVTEMLTSAQSIMTNANQAPLFLAVIEEGGPGTTSPVANALNTTVYSAAYTYASKEDGVTQLSLDMSEMGKGLSALGFNLNLMPYSNCSSISDSTVGVRSYGEDYTKTAEMVSTVVKGLHTGGVAAAMKYFPTSGSLNSNGLYVSDKSLTDLRTYDMVPFKAGISAETDIIIVGHVQIEAVDAGTPADLSSKVVGNLLRSELAYDGIIMTASLSDSAVSAYSAGELAVQAVQAGCDMLYNTNDLSSALASLKSAVSHGTIKESQIDASVKRILTAKINRGIMDEPSTETATTKKN